MFVGDREDTQDLPHLADEAKEVYPCSTGRVIHGQSSLDPE